MPNWCSSRVRICGNEEVLSKVYTELDKAIHMDMFSDDKERFLHFHEGWLGNLIGYFGKSLEEVESVKGFGFRGEIQDCERTKNEVTLWIESAWSPQFGAINYFLDKLGVLDDVQLFYTADEPGNELYISNDPDDVGTYVYDDMEKGITEYGLSIVGVRDCIDESCKARGIENTSESVPDEELGDWINNTFNVDEWDVNLFQYEYDPFENNVY